MSIFGIYFRLGFEHITDLGGYDHMLFLMALCAVFTIREWRRVLILVTAFTLGHSITLAMSVLGWVIMPSNVIEFLIPLTILITSLFNIFRKIEDRKPKLALNYGLALFFGLIHGMGFSNYLRALLGAESEVLTPLFGFNVGLEVGQILVVIVFLGASYLILDILKAARRDWIVFISGATAGISLLLMTENKFW